MILRISGQKRYNPFIMQTTFKQTLDELWLLIDANEINPFPHDSEAVCKLLEFYNINESETIILSCLMHAYPGKVLGHVLWSALENMEDNPMSVICYLEDKGLVYSAHDQLPLQYALQKEVHDAICGMEPLDFLPGERSSSVPDTVRITDCLEALMSSSMIGTSAWLKAFNAALERPGNEQLKAAAVELALPDLPSDEQGAFWTMAGHLARNFMADFDPEEAFLPGMESLLSRLVKRGLVDAIPIYNDGSPVGVRYALTAKAAGLLFHGHDEVINYDDISRYARIVRSRDIDEKELYFSGETLQDVNHLRKMLSEDGFSHVCRILVRKKRNPAIHTLLWGPPGTGKTETARQLARESGRDIIRFDVSRVTGSGWGVTEKNYQDLFRAYSYIAAISPRVPILLLNEADAVLSRRFADVERSIDKAENTVTDILLDAFETMSGIVIATSNFIDGMDEAFDRRFLFKTRMDNPTSEARFSIWKSLIPELNDAEAGLLAGKFEMSGAQISNVAAKRDLAELYGEEDRGFDFISKLCQQELSIAQRKMKSRVGF